MSFTFSSASISLLVFTRLLCDAFFALTGLSGNVILVLVALNGKALYPLDLNIR